MKLQEITEKLKSKLYVGLDINTANSRFRNILETPPISMFKYI